MGETGKDAESAQRQVDEAVARRQEAERGFQAFALGAFLRIAEVPSRATRRSGA